RTSHFELVTLDYLSAEMTIDTLIDIAVDNLEKELDGKIKLSDTTFGAKMLTCGGNFEASLLLVHSVWEGVFEQLGDDLIVAFPAKDLAFCVSASDVAAITALKQVIEEVHKEGEQLLSKQLFRKTKDNLEVYLPLPTIA
ncbi:hypothetical protein L6Q79_16285, partial [bacterium]|nr:hypothetical protein [bacterium]